MEGGWREAAVFRFQGGLSIPDDLGGGWGAMEAWESILDVR